MSPHDLFFFFFLNPNTSKSSVLTCPHPRSANSPAHLQTGEFLGWAWRVVGSLPLLLAQLLLQLQPLVEAAVAAARAVVGGQLGTHLSAKK